MKSRKLNRTSASQVVFKDKEILTSRPEGMKYEEWRILLRIQNTVMKTIFRGSPSQRIANLMSKRVGYNVHVQTPTFRPQQPVQKINTPRKAT